MTVRAHEVPAGFDLSSVDVVVPTAVKSAAREGDKKTMASLPAGVSFFSAGFPKSPPNAEPLVKAVVPTAVPSFLSPSLGGPNRDVVIVGVVSFFSSGFVASLLVAAPNSPPAVVPPVPPKGRPPVVGGTGVEVPEASGFLVPNKLPPSPGAVVEVELTALSAGFGGSPKIPPVAGVVVDVDESPAGLGGPPNKPPTVVFVLGGPLNRLPGVAAKKD